MDFERLSTAWSKLKAISKQAWTNWLEITILLITIIGLLTPVAYLAWSWHVNDVAAKVAQQKSTDDAQWTEIHRVDAKIDTFAQAVIAGGKK